MSREQSRESSRSHGNDSNRENTAVAQEPVKSGVGPTISPSTESTQPPPIPQKRPRQWLKNLIAILLTFPFYYYVRAMPQGWSSEATLLGLVFTAFGSMIVPLILISPVLYLARLRPYSKTVRYSLVLGIVVLFWTGQFGEATKEISSRRNAHREMVLENDKFKAGLQEFFQDARDLQSNRVVPRRTYDRGVYGPYADILQAMSNYTHEVADISREFAQKNLKRDERVAVILSNSDSHPEGLDEWLVALADKDAELTNYVRSIRNTFKSLGNDTALSALKPVERKQLLDGFVFADVEMLEPMTLAVREEIGISREVAEFLIDQQGHFRIEKGIFVYDSRLLQARADALASKWLDAQKKLSEMGRQAEIVLEESERLVGK